MIEVLEPGLYTTVQDSGRTGYTARGIPPSGAFDNYALRIANRLVGNPPSPPMLTAGDPGAAALEATLLGPSLAFREDATVAITGGAAAVTIDGRPAPQWESVRVARDAVLKIGTVTTGARCYVAIAGGIDVPPYLGSRSTFVLGGFGGLDGRQLKRGDVLPVGSPTTAGTNVVGRSAPTALIPDYPREWVVRATPGPQDGLFEPDSVELFFEAEWEMSPMSDRIGCRFTGHQLRFRDRSTDVTRDAGADPSNIVDDVIPLGGIQVPGGNQPIAFGVDLFTAGGYAKIATVISSDLRHVAQMRPRDRVRFARCTIEEATAAAREVDERIEREFRA